MSTLDRGSPQAEPSPLVGLACGTSEAGYARSVSHKMQTIDHNLVEIALERVNGSDFERFFHAFYPALAGIDFVPLGGLHDGGADAFEGDALFEGEGNRPETFYQATTQKDHRVKIRQTVQRLREFGREPTAIQYVTSRIVAAVDMEEEKLSDELGIAVKIRDRKWITVNVNHSTQTLAAFNSHLRPYLSFLQELGGATTIGTSTNIATRTLCVFLGQEIDQRRGNTEVLEAVSDSLILWALEGTDPDADIFMTRDEILGKIETALPSARHFIRGVFKHRIETMAAKGNPTGREVRWHKKEDKFCLPYETRRIVEQENIEDETLKRQVLNLYEDRAAKMFAAEETLSPDEVAKLTHRSLELTFEQQGLELAAFLTGHDENRDLAIADQVDRAIQDTGWTGADAVKAKEVALAILRQAFYGSTEAERVYYGKLSRTYTLMLTMRNEPRVVEYFKGMSSNCVLFVGADIIVRALSESYLAAEDRMTINMLRILQDAGSTLIVTHTAVEEVHSHIRITDYEYQNYFRELEPYVSREIARHSNKILLRAYFTARLALPSEEAPSGWGAFVEQICSYSDLHKEVASREQVKQYLIEKFGFEYMDTSDLREFVNEDEVLELAEQISSIKSGDVLARNDARHVLAVYGKRQALKEGQRPNPYGYRTWWLTHESRIRSCTKELVKLRGSEYIIRPEFILNFVALSPTTESVRKSYKTIFPSLLGIKLSNRMREHVFQDVMRRAKEVGSVDEARAKVMMSDMSNRLKGDNYKVYEAELSGESPIM